MIQEDEIEKIDLFNVLKRYLLPHDEERDFKKKTTNEILTICGSVGIGLMSDIWLGIWSADVLGLSLSLYLFIYVLLSGLQAISIIVRSLKVRFGL